MLPSKLLSHVRRFLLLSLLLFSGFSVASEPRILVMGDSLSAGYGIDLKDG